MVEVAAAVIKQKDKVLICQRPENKNCALLWEFPGGKQEQGETLPQTLMRECKEELDINIKVGREVFSTLNTASNIRLHFFEAEITSGKLKSKEHKTIVWAKTKELKLYEFCPSDKDFILSIEH